MAIVLFCLTFLVFGNGIFNEYALDDEFYTAGANKATQKGFAGIKEIFTTRTFYNNDGSGYSYRPVAVASFAIEIQLFGEKPRVSHFINVLLYAFSMILVFGLLRKWFKNQGDWFAFFITLIFLVHPVHTETVDNIKCRDELLAFFFCLLMLRFIWKQIETRAVYLWALAGLSFAAAILSKTTIAPMVFLVPFAVWFFTDKKWWQAALYVLPAVGAVVLLKLLMASTLPDMSRTMQGFESLDVKSMGIGEITATASYVLGRYLWLMFIPYPLIYYYGLNEVPPGDWSNPVSIISLIVHLALLVWTWFEFRKRTPAGFGMIFYFANIILFSNLIMGTPGIMAERWTYVASLGFCIAATDMIFRLYKFNPASFDWKAVSSSRLRMTFVVIAVLFSVRSILRNETWEDKETLYRHDIELAPESAKANMLLGSLLSSQAAQKNFESQQIFKQAQQLAMQGNQSAAQQAQLIAKEKRDSAYSLFYEAREYYRKSTEVFPDYYTAWSNLGTAYYFTQEYRNGIPFFKKAIEIKADYAEAYFNLGMTYEQLSLTKGVLTDSILIDSSVYYFSQGIKQDPKYVNSAEQLSRILYQHYGDSVRSINVLKQAANDNPKSDVPWNAMGNIYLQANDTISAVAALEKAAELNPGNAQRLGNLAAYFQRVGNMEKASYYNSLFQKQRAEIEKKEKLLGRRKK